MMLQMGMDAREFTAFFRPVHGPGRSGLHKADTHFVFRGFYNCLDEDGSVYDTTKYGWLQGRQVDCPITYSLRAQNKI